MYSWQNLKSKEENGYKLLENERHVATIFLADKKSSFKATLKIDEKEFKIRRKGFWKSIVVVIDEEDEIIARLDLRNYSTVKALLKLKRYVIFINM